MWLVFLSDQGVQGAVTVRSPSHSAPEAPVGGGSHTGQPLGVQIHGQGTDLSHYLRQSKQAAHTGPSRFHWYSFQLMKEPTFFSFLQTQRRANEVKRTGEVGRAQKDVPGTNSLRTIYEQIIPKRYPSPGVCGTACPTSTWMHPTHFKPNVPNTKAKTLLIFLPQTCSCLCLPSQYMALPINRLPQPKPEGRPWLLPLSYPSSTHGPFSCSSKCSSDPSALLRRSRHHPHLS